MAYYQTQSAQPPVHFPQYPPFSHTPELYAPHHAQQHRMQQPPPPQGYPNSYEHSQPDPQHYYPPPSGQRPVYPSDVSIPQGSQSGYKMSNYGGQTGGYGQQNSSQRLDPPRLSSNYIPGGQDDYYQMPELISPSPQRIMPEVPSNMQDSLAALELEARNPQRVASQSTVSSQYSASQARGGTPAEQRPAGPQYTASYDHTNASAYQNMEADSLQPAPLHNHPPESPNFSPFPRPRNAGPNVPMTNDDKEDSLERARPGVLKCNNPEIQLAWAQDALGWVEIASQNSARIAEGTGSTRSVTPRIEHQLRVDALSIVNFLAEQQHPKAEFIKAMWLEFGKFGYRVDKKEAFLGYRRAAERGYARAEYRIGMQYESTNDSAKAIKHYNIGVNLKDSASNYRLGMMVLLGQHNQLQNYQHGLELIRFAADTADENAPQGAYVYGMLLARELPNINIPDPFLPLDMNEAKLFIEKAAYLGFAKAQLKMAQAYELCQLGCDFDPALSLHYNALAARQGEPEADMAISKWFLCGYEGIFEKNEELAFTYAKRAAQTKMATAEFAMGYFYEIGMYVTKDIQEAAMWYQKAADHGNKDALGRIDSISHNKTLSKSDHEQVALSRIKSQYGSMRGKRPDRLKQRGAAMPSMSEENINMPPDHRDSYVRPQSNPPPAVRPVSVAPYPEDDVANGRGGPQPPRSPYYRPDVRASSGLGPPIADRPSSAFGIRPPAHSNTAPYPAGSLHPHADPVRPATSQGNAPMSGGTNIAPPNRAPSPYWEPQKPAGYRDPSPARVPVQSQQAGRMQKQPPVNYNKPQPPMPFQPQPGADVGRKPVASSGYPGQVPAQINTPPYDGRTSVASSNQQRPTPPMTPQHQQLQSPPPRFDSAQSMRQEPSRASQRPVQQTMSSQDPKASIATASSASSTSSKVKPGPSTFEEMGIPAGKTEGDCIVM